MLRFLLIMLLAGSLGTLSACQAIPPVRKVPAWQSSPGHEQADVGVIRDLSSGRELTPQQLAERFGEIAAITSTLRGQEADTHSGAAQTAWLREVSAVLIQRPAWWTMMPAAWLQKREMRLLKERGLFDEEAYLARYPDVARAGITPLRHFILHGMAEGRKGQP